jgi:hypothetical protein
MTESLEYLWIHTTLVDKTPHSNFLHTMQCSETLITGFIQLGLISTLYHPTDAKILQRYYHKLYIIRYMYFASLLLHVNTEICKKLA